MQNPMRLEQEAGLTASRQHDLLGEEAARSIFGAEGIDVPFADDLRAADRASAAFSDDTEHVTATSSKATITRRGLCNKIPQRPPATTPFALG